LVSNKNVFYATNPARISDALWQVISESGVDVADMLIFLPSRRAVRSVEKMIAEKKGGVAMLPTLVPLGDGADFDEVDDDITGEISDTERVVVLAKLLAADVSVGNLSTGLLLAHDLVRMQDYLENEGVDASEIDWENLVDEKYATHFQNKARILNILSGFSKLYAGNRMTSVQIRNRDIRNWVNHFDKYKLVVVCASTASVPATADLMRGVYNLPHGRIILSGKIDGRVADFELDTNPYNSEHKFLNSIGMTQDDVLPIDVGSSAIDFMNYAFGNDCVTSSVDTDLSHCHLVVAPTEAVEANAVAHITKRALNESKSVLIITPDAAGNQRIANAFVAHGIDADFSSAISGAMTNTGRALLNLMDGWIESGSGIFDKLYSQSDFNLFDTIAKIVDENLAEFKPAFVIDDETSVQIWTAIKKMSDALVVADIKLTLADARAFVADALSNVSERGAMKTDARVVVLGTIESRMQTADVVILTGLNDGMFPAQGYENAWLPVHVAKDIGLPSPNRKVSLQSLDFMNLSCGGEVYWLRSAVSGGVQTSESRFISRVIARRAQINTDVGEKIIADVLSQDDVPYIPLDESVPTPPADWSDVFVTELELLIHNPYAFYVRHILKLRVLDDYWVVADARKFGNLVHGVIENATDLRPDVLVAQMDAGALEILGRGSILFHFWHKRFLEIAPVIANELTKIQNAKSEIEGGIKIAGRNVRARADLVWDGGVMDFKTGVAPNKKQLLDGNMPQLPLEAFMLQSGGFKIQTSPLSNAPIMKFLQLKNNDVRVIEYDQETTQQMINAAVAKTTELFNMYSAGNAGYEYHETNDRKYKIYDDLKRV
jgi:inactivated superfamily I helicase/RecB family exonuclease